MHFEQRGNIMLQNIAKEAHGMFQSGYGDYVVTLKTIYKWFEL